MDDCFDTQQFHVSGATVVLDIFKLSYLDIGLLLAKTVTRRFLRNPSLCYRRLIHTPCNQSISICRF